MPSNPSGFAAGRGAGFGAGTGTGGLKTAWPPFWGPFGMGTPAGGVGAIMRGARRWPHSWQKTRCPGLSLPQVAQITRLRWDTLAAPYVKRTQ